MVTAPKKAAAILPQRKCRRPTAGRTRSGRWRPPWRPADRDGGVSTRELGGQRCGGDDAQESVGHLGVDLQRRDPRRYV